MSLTDFQLVNCLYSKLINFASKILQVNSSVIYNYLFICAIAIKTIIVIIISMLE